MGWSAAAAQLIHRCVATRAGTWVINRALIERHERALVRALMNPVAAQQAILADLIPRAAYTSFGRDHGLHPHMDLEQYRQRVPVRRYEELRPYVDRMLLGEPDVLWPGRVTWFAESSGTSGPKKQIPMTRCAHRHVYQATATAYVCRLASRTGLSRFLAGRSVFFAGGFRRLERPAGFLAGDITALSLHLTPWYLDWARTPAKEIAVIADCNWEDRLQRMARATRKDNVVHLAGLPTWLLHFASLVLAQTGASALVEIWPNLAAVTTGGVNPGPYWPELRRLLVGDTGHSLLECEVYNGTEGFYAMQVDEGPMALLPHGGVFYEFVPHAEASAPRLQEALSLADVQTGVDYALVVSTYGGLWRYLIGDVIRFVDTDPYRLEVRGRLNQFLSIAGEELLGAVCDEAITKACRELRVTPVDYMVAAVKLYGAPENAFHLWLVEIREPHDVSGEQLAEVLDGRLCGRHYDYAKMRAPGAVSNRGLGLGPPLVLLLPAGSFRRWLDRCLGDGIGAQSKVPRLTHDLQGPTELLAQLERAVLEQQLAAYPPHYGAAIAGQLQAYSTA